jgi:hypothetical protein
MIRKKLENENKFSGEVMFLHSFKLPQLETPENVTYKEDRR